MFPVLSIDNIIALLEYQRLMPWVAYPDKFHTFSLVHCVFHRESRLVPFHPMFHPIYFVLTFLLAFCVLCSVGTNHGNDPRSVSDP